MVSIDEIFLPYMVDGAGNTLYELFRKEQILLSDGEKAPKEDLTQ